MPTLQQLAEANRRGSGGGYQLAPEQRRSLLRSLTGSAIGGIEALGLVLDTPGAIARGILAGDPLSGFAFDSDRRVTGSELLDAYGLKVPKKVGGSKFAGSAARFATGLAAEIALDPMWLAKFGSAATSLAGKVLGKTQYADDVQRFAARKLVDAPLEQQRKAGAFLDDAFPVAAEQEFVRNQVAQTATGRRMLDIFDANRIPMIAGMREVAPPVGPRYARATTTPADIVKFTPEGERTKVLNDIAVAAEKLGTTYDEIKNMPLGGLMSVGNDLVGGSKTFNPSWGLKWLDAMDSLGAAIKYSSPAVKAAQLFQKGVDQAPTLRGQLMALRRNQINAPIAADWRVRITVHSKLAAKANEAFQQSDAAKSLLGTDTLLSRAGNDTLTRIVEGVPNPTDEQVLSLVPELQAWKDSWSQIRDDILDRKQAMGIDVSDMTDPFGVQWSPRVPEEAQFSPFSRTPKSRTRVSGIEDQSDMGRKVQTPGGTVDIRELSQEPAVQDWVRSIGTNEGQSEKQMMDWVRSWLARKYGGLVYVKNVNAYKFQALKHPQTGDDLFINRQQLKTITGLLKRYKTEFFDNLPLDRQVPLFSASPPIAQARGMESTARALGNTEFVYETLADSAVRQRANTIPGAGYKRLDAVLDNVTKDLGLARKAAGEVDGVPFPAGPDDVVIDNLKDRLLAKVAQSEPGFTKDSLDLSAFSVPEEVAEALTERIASFVSPTRQKEVAGFLDSFTALFKNTVLARPARFNRDFLSNGLAVFFETGSASATARGFWNASRILAGDYEGAAEYLRSFPRYKNLGTTEQIMDQLAKDASRTKLLGGLASSDLFRRNSTLALSEYYPGSSPRTISGALGQMASDLTPSANRSVADIARDFTKIRGVGFFGPAPTDTANPLFKASEAVGDTVDAVGRLGGFLALLESGNSVEQAAKRMKKALVDYSSLTNFERDRLVKVWFPWWAYNSRIGAYVVGSLAKDPGGRYGQTVRFFNNLQGQSEDGYVPTSLRQNIALNLSPLLGQVAPGVDRYLTKFDVPGFDVLGTYATQPNSLLPDIRDTLKNVALQMAPAPRMFMELASNRDTFTGRPLDEADTTANRVYQYFRGPGYNLSGPTKVLLANFPPAQFLEPFVRPATDTRVDPLDRLTKFLTNYGLGIVGTQDVDAEYRAADIMRTMEPQMRGVMRTMQRQYLPKDRAATLTPEQMLQVQLYQDMANEKALLQKQRQEKQGGRR